MSKKGFRDVSAAGLKALFRLAAGRDTASGIACRKLREQGYAEEFRPGWVGSKITAKGEELVKAARAAGY